MEEPHSIMELYMDFNDGCGEKQARRGDGLRGNTACGQPGYKFAAGTLRAYLESILCASFLHLFAPFWFVVLAWRQPGCVRRSKNPSKSYKKPVHNKILNGLLEPV